MAKGIALQPAYVLHRRPYRNTSALIEVLSLDLGRIGLVARGLRRPRSPLTGTLEPFRPVLLSWSGRGELGTLTNAEAAAHTPAIDHRRLLSGFYINELVMRLLPRQAPDRRLFAHYAEAIAELAGETSESILLRRFEKALLEALGYGPELNREADTGASLDPDAAYVCPPDSGPVRCRPGYEAEGPVVHGSTLLALQRGEFSDPRNLREARDLMRALLAPRLGDRPLHSRQMYAAFLRLKG